MGWHIDGSDTRVERAQALLPFGHHAGECRVAGDAGLQGSPLPGVHYAEDILTGQHLVGGWLQPVFVA
jgi:hypothetical protein